MHLHNNRMTLKIVIVCYDFKKIIQIIIAKYVRNKVDNFFAYLFFFMLF
jgi:hypothetical protein